MCVHDWDGKSGLVKCALCTAVGLRDKANDPFKEGEVVILKPGYEDWKELSHRERHQVFEKNKNHILIDLKTIGRAATCKRWSMATSTLSQLIDRWNAEAGGAAAGGAAAGGAAAPPGPAVTPVLPELPPLPEWDKKWPTRVQLQWLKVYEIMLSREQ